MGFALPVGFAAVLTGWGWIATIAAGLLTVSRAVVNWQAAIEQNWRIPTPPPWLGAALSAATIAVALTARQPRRMPHLAAIAATAILLARPHYGRSREVAAGAPSFAE